jgi:lipid-A-disaccharide synthase
MIALLPGSRGSEVDANLTLLLDAARRVALARPGARFVIPLATERLRDAVEIRLAELDFDVALAPPEHSDEAMRASDAAIAVSGTATLHLVHHRVPTVVCYRSSKSGLLLARVLLVSPYIALPNLLSGREALREFLTSSGDGSDLAAALISVLPGGADRAAALSALDDIARRLDAPGVADRAARWVLDTVDRSR